MSGWNDSDRKSRLPANWSKLVKAVKIRAGGRCEARLPRTGSRCPRPGTDCDHKVEGDDHSMSNLQWLCGFHHDKKTARHAHAAKKKKRAIPRQERRRHPGLIG